MKIYHTAVRTIITYAVENRVDTTRTGHLLRSTERKTLRSILGLTLWDKIRSKECGIQDIVKWTKDRRLNWDQQVDRANGEGLIEIARDGSPGGRPPKRWSWASSSTGTCVEQQAKGL